MITVDTTARVRRACFVQKRKIKAFARELKLARNTVRDIVRAGANGETERAYIRKDQPLPQLGDHVAALETMLASAANCAGLHVLCDCVFSDGRMRLARDWWRPWGQKQLRLDWDVTASEPTMKAFIAMHKTLSEATGGTPLVPPSWSLARYLVTPHPLGGCNMGTAAENGVVDHRGQVFGYPNLFVSDGSIVPLALGLNPSRTIAALAERNAEQMLALG